MWCTGTHPLPEDNNIDFFPDKNSQLLSLTIENFSDVLNSDQLTLLHGEWTKTIPFESACWNANMLLSFNAIFMSKEALCSPGGHEWNFHAGAKIWDWNSVVVVDDAQI